jgi:hypothetical protein
MIQREGRSRPGQFRTYALTGDADRGPGTNHVSLEPGLLLLRQLGGGLALEGEFRAWVPVGGTDFAGNILRAGLGVSYTVPYGESIRQSPMLELVGWTDGVVHAALVEAEPVVVRLAVGPDPEAVAVDAHPGPLLEPGPHLHPRAYPGEGLAHGTSYRFLTPFRPQNRSLRGSSGPISNRERRMRNSARSRADHLSRWATAASISRSKLTISLTARRSRARARFLRDMLISIKTNIATP